MSQQRFAALAESLFREQFAAAQHRRRARPRHLADVSDGGQREGDRARLPQRTRCSATACAEARDTGELVLAGPVDLVQGGHGFIGRFPVFVDEPAASERFWGIVSAVIDVQNGSIATAACWRPDLPIEIALTGKDALGDPARASSATPTVLEDNPVTADVILPSGSWQIAADPQRRLERDPSRTPGACGRSC